MIQTQICMGDLWLSLIGRHAYAYNAIRMLGLAWIEPLTAALTVHCNGVLLV